MKKCLCFILIAALIFLPKPAQSAEQYINRMDAVTLLLETIVKASDTEYISWDGCYVEDGDGGYNLVIKGKSEYPLIYGLYPHIAAPPFSDISGATRYERIALSLAYATHIVQGFGDNTFRPKDSLTYLQAIKITEWSRWAGLEQLRLSGQYSLPDSLVSPVEGLTWPIDFSDVLVNSPIIDSDAIQSWNRDYGAFVTPSAYKSMLDKLIEYKNVSMLIGGLFTQ